MALNVGLLRSSFELVAPKGEQVVDRFYTLLFEKHPSVKPLFANTTQKEQGKKLLRSLSIVVQNLEKPDVLAPYLQGLGRMHVAFGTQEAHYDAVGGCLLQALAETAGPAWNATLESAWAEAYGVVAKLMKDGARAS
jgi:hemoglobin-like flavoprotein